MIAFAVFVTDAERYVSGARVWIEAVREPSSAVVEVEGHATVAVAYNEILDGLRDQTGIDAVVFVDQAATLPGGAEFGASLRALLADDDVGLARIRAQGEEQYQAFALAPWGVAHMHCRADADADPATEFAQLAQLAGYEVRELTVPAAA